MRKFVWVVLSFSLLKAFSGLAQTPVTVAPQYFYNAATFGTGPSPAGVAIVDVNSDGRADLLVPNSNVATISLLLGQADGTFGPKTEIPLQESSLEIVTGDFNGDRKVDVAVIQTSGVAVLLGKGDGTFQAPVMYPLANRPYFLALSDLNRDGKMDLVAAGSCGATCGFVSVLLGKGDGTFSSQPDFSPGGVPQQFTVLDLNGDGSPDLAFANWETVNPGASNGHVSVLLGKGDGTFQAPVNYGLGYIAGITAGDVTGDKKPDLIVSYYTSPNITLMKGNGDGTFQPEVAVPVTDLNLTSEFPQLIDLNGDGKLDLVMSSVFDSGAAVLLGNGDGTFQPVQTYATGPQPYFYAFGDVNGDGNLDWVMTDSQSAYVAVLLGNGDGTFSPRRNLPLGAGQPYFSMNGAAIADFNGDGKPDVAVSTQPGLTVLLNKGDGTFQAPIVVDSTDNWVVSQGSVGDFNRDGKLDLIVNGAIFLPGKGDGTFGTPVSLGGDPNGPRSFVTGDFNGDGKLDLLVVGNGFLESQPMQMMLGNGDGTFQAPRHFWNLTSIPDKIVAGDFNHDGKLDVAVTVNPNGVAVLLGDGTGAFAPPVIYATDNLPDGLTVGDLNGDGKLDLVATGSKVDVFLGKGDGTFPTRVDYSITGFPGQPAIGDFNGDGKLDLAVSGFGSGPGYLGILFGNGDGTLQAPRIFSATSLYDPVLVADLNGDGIDDPLIVSAKGSLFLSGPVATVSPSVLNFGSVATGANSPAMNITVTNSGNGPLHVTGATTATPFAIAGSACTAPLPYLSNCTIPVVLDPSTAGAQAGQVLIHEDAINSKPVVAVMGTAANATISVSPASLDFGNQAVTTQSAAQTVALKNTSSVAITIASLKASDGFAVSSQCGTVLAAATACSVSVTFAPAATGQKTGTLTIADNAQGAPHQIAVSGTGVAALTMAAQAGGSTSATVTGGTTASYAQNVAAAPGFSGTVSLSCTGAPTYATCTIAPSSLAVTSGSAANFTVSVATSQQVASDDRRLAPWANGMLLSVLLVPVILRRSRIRSGLLLWMAAFAIGLVGCGGGSGGSTGPVTHTVAPGTYQLTVNAGSGQATATENLTLIVQ